VWAYDFVQYATHDGKNIRMLTMVDEYTRECLAIRVDRSLHSERVLEQLASLFIHRGLPEHIRSDSVADIGAQSLRRTRCATGSRRSV
jgi:putative transposase